MSPTADVRRERQTLDSATLTSGAHQLIDFALPLFAGAALGLSAAQTGALLAANQLVAFLVRPLAGIIVDRTDRSGVAATGAVVFAAGCGLYAVSTGWPTALLAAAVTGVAGAFLDVAIRAIIGERIGQDSGVFARLVGAEETGGWLVVVPGIILVSVAGYRWAFLGVALCCLVAAALLLGGRGRSAVVPDPSPSSPEARTLRRRLAPMLAAVAVTTMAEAAISLLLMLHLQRGFGLGPVEIAYVYMPGAIAMSVLPPVLHGLVVRLGRRRMLTAASLLSALFAAALSLAPNPYWIAGLWVLSAVGWSVVIPVEQAVVAEASGAAHLGRGLSLYEAACLAGSFAGSLAAGVLYGSGSWTTACLVLATVILCGAALVPGAVGRLGVADRPGPTPSAQPAPAWPEMHEPAGECSAVKDPAAPDAPGGTGRKPRWKVLAEFAVHSGILATVVIVLAARRSGVWHQVLNDGRLDLGSLFGEVPDVARGLRIWLVIYLIDLVWTACELISPPRRQSWRKLRAIAPDGD